MLIIKNIFLLIAGLSGGFMVSGGIFALISTIGIVPRMADKTKTQDKILLYENASILGGTIGSLIHIYLIPLHLGKPLLILYGIFSGMFIGCLAVSLAESLNATAVFARRSRLHRGMGIIVICIALGKLLGSMLFFYKRF